MDSARILGHENAEDTQGTGEGSATQGVDPSVPFDPETTPTSAEGTAAAPINVDSINVDSTSFEGNLLDDRIDSVALNPQPLPPRDGYEYRYEWPLDDSIDPIGPVASDLLDSALFL